MAEKVIKSEDIAQSDIFKDMRDSAAQTIPVMKELSTMLGSFLNQTKEQVKANPLGSAQDINGLTSAWNGATSAAQQKLKIDKEIAVVQAQIEASFHAESNSLSANAVKLAENRLSRAELNKEIKQTAILRKAEEGSLEALRVKLSQATKELDKMSAATLKTAAGLAQIEKVKNVSLAISEVEQASGRFYRNVGNYKSGYDGLAASINQLTREAPSAAVSMNTFFLAISNNIPMLVDQINQIKKANIELAESGKPTVSVLGKVASAFFSWQTLISAGITILTVFGGKLIDYISGTKKATENQYDFNKSLDETNAKFKEIATNAESAYLRLQVALGLLNKDQASELQRYSEYRKKRQEINDAYNLEEKKSRDELNKESGYVRTAQDIEDSSGFKSDTAVQNYLARRDKIAKERAAKLRELSIGLAQNELAIATENANKISNVEDKRKAEKVVKEKQEAYDSLVLRDNNYKQELEYQEDFYKKEQIKNDNAYTNNEIDYNQYQYNKTKIDEKWNQTRLDLAIKYEQDTLDIQKQEADEKAKEKKKADDDWSKEQDEFIKGVVNSWDDEEKKRKAKLAAATKERIEREKQLFTALEQISNTRYANEEKRLDRTIANSQRQQQTLALLAQNGVDNAKESLAAEQKIQADAEAKKAELQKKKERTEFAMTVLKMTTANLEANQGDPAKALIDTGVQVGALIALIQGLPSFFVGTEDTGSGGGLDGKGGFLSVLHPNERVMTAEQNAMIGDISNKEAAKVLSMYNAGLMPQVAYMPNYNSTQSSDVVKKLNDVEKAIKQIEIPVQSWAYDATEKAIIERVETRNKVITNHIKPKAGIWS